MAKTILPSATTPGATYILSALGPLTTVFTPSSSCSTTTTTIRSQLLLAAAARCLAPNFTPSDERPTGLAYLNYFSPGVCPSGYYTAMTIPQRLLRADETGYRCCPSEYVFQAVTWAPQGTVLSICASTVGARAVWAAEVPIVWRSGDFPGGISRTVAAGDAGTVSAAPPPLGQASPSVSVAPIPVPVVPANAVAVIVGVMTMLVLGAVVLVAVCHWRRRTAMSKPHPWEPELDGTPMCEVHAEEKAPRRELS